MNSTANSAPAAKNSWKEILQRVPKFTGDPTKFKRWKDAFELYVDSTPMDPLEKFQLKLKTVAGKVPECIAIWDVSADNYGDARDTIYDRYGDIALAEDQHVDDVVNACIRKEVNTDEKFVSFVNTVSLSIAALVNLGNSYEGMSAFVARLIMNALPYERRQRFDDVYVPGNGECKLRVLVEFLNAERKQVERLTDRQKAAHRALFESRMDKSGQSRSTKSKAFQFKRFEDRRFSPARPTGATGNQFAFAALTSQQNRQSVDHTCIFCLEQHASNRCRKYMSPDERRKCATTRNACYKCLNRNHRVDKCKAKGCARCKGRHHELLCFKPSEDTVTSASLTMASEEVASVNTVKMVNVAERRLPTGYVEVIGEDKESVSRLVLDTGSQKTLVTEKLADRLNARTLGIDSFYLQTAGSALPKKCKGRIVEITLKSRFSDQHVVIHATALPNVVEGSLPGANFKGKLDPIADQNDGAWSDEINVLVGVDFLYPILGQNIKKEEGFLAIETVFGYFLCGTGQHQEGQVNPGLIKAIQSKREAWVGSKKQGGRAVVSLAAVIKAKYDPEDIAFLWQTETLGIESPGNESDEAAAEEVMDFFRKTTKRRPNGRYVVQLPFKPNLNTLGHNRDLTERRLKSFLAQARKDPKLLVAADAEMEYLLKQGFIELAESPKVGEQAHYLPLLAVVKKQTSVKAGLKLRLVNDASARSKDEAGLNDVLYRGGNLIADLILVLLQFRQLELVITADIEKAYLQNEIVPEHRNFLRFLWPLGIGRNPKAPVRELRSCRLSFGLVSAPFLHCASIRNHLENEIRVRPKDKELLEFVKKYFYVDDLMVGAKNVEHGKYVVETLHDAFASGCFPLKKWATGSPELAAFIKQRYPEVSVASGDTNFKFLGVRWNQVTDTLHIDVLKTIAFFESSKPTKRSLLKGLSQVFDPTGLASPILIGMKQLMQKYWKRKYDWDQVLTGEDLEEYRSVTERLKYVNSLSVRRNFWETKGDSSTAVRELHLFCDSSLTSYGCVAYARDVTDKNNVSVSLIMAKGRVAPLKGDWSIHRLELWGAILAVRIAKKIQEAANKPFASVHFWCDNACVLAWIRDRPERWKSFIGNRVIEIQSKSSSSQWQYVRTAQNCADLVSRASALETKELQDFWLYGPKWLRTGGKPEAHRLNALECEREVSNERRSEGFLGLVSVEVEPFVIKRMSSWPETVRVVAYIYRWRRYKKHPKPKWLTAIPPEEYGEAELVIIKNIQRRHFAGELESQLRGLSKRSQIYQFNPFLDQQGLIRCRSRLSNMEEVNFEVANPIILPGEDDLVDSYARWIHEKVCMHAGSIPGILQRVRSRFLIIRARRAARKAVTSCKVCVKYRAKPAAEPMPELPKFRVQTAVAFSTTGVDAAGPIAIKNREGKKVPAYLMLFICSVSRAIRIELVENLTAYECLMAIRRFYNRNPTVTCFFSDNAASFRRAAKEVKILFDLARSEETQGFLTKHRISWKFNTERSPWRAGFVERTFRVIKDPLRKVMGKNLLLFRDLETLLTDIEKIVNDRPLTCVSSSPDEILPLRPSDLLYGNRAYPALPELKEVLENSEHASATVFSERWKHQQNVINAFWNRFRKEYLLQLRTGLQSKPIRSCSIKVGDVVLIDDPAPSRSYWPMARVQSLSGGEGSDNRKRTCIIKLTNGKTLKRPIQSLYRLDVSQY